MLTYQGPLFKCCCCCVGVLIYVVDGGSAEYFVYWFVECLNMYGLGVGEIVCGEVREFIPIAAVSKRVHVPPATLLVTVIVTNQLLESLQHINECSYLKH